MPDNCIGMRQFTDGRERPVFEDFRGRQYVFDEDDNRVYGIWIVSREDFCDSPVIVEGERS